MTPNVEPNKRADFPASSPQPVKKEEAGKQSILQRIAMKLDGTGLFDNYISFHALVKKLQPDKVDEFSNMYMKIQTLQRKMNVMKVQLQDVSNENDVKALSSTIKKAEKLNKQYQRLYAQFRVAEGSEKLKRRIHPQSELSPWINQAHSVLSKLRDQKQLYSTTAVELGYIADERTRNVAESSRALYKAYENNSNIDEALQKYANARDQYLSLMNYISSPSGQASLKKQDSTVGIMLSTIVSDTDADDIIQSTDQLIISKTNTLPSRQL